MDGDRIGKEKLLGLT